MARFPEAERRRLHKMICMRRHFTLLGAEHDILHGRPVKPLSVQAWSAEEACFVGVSLRAKARRRYSTDMMRALTATKGPKGMLKFSKGHPP